MTLRVAQTVNTEQLHVECKTKSDTSNNRGNWKHVEVTQIVTQQHTVQARNQGTTENSHIGHCTRTAGSGDVQQKDLKWKRSSTCTMNCNYIIAATQYNL
jgi:hypothetical protein